MEARTVPDRSRLMVVVSRSAADWFWWKMEVGDGSKWNDDRFQACSVDLCSFEMNSFKPSMVAVRGSTADWSWWSIGGRRWSVVSGQWLRHSLSRSNGNGSGGEWYMVDFEE